MRQGRQAHKDQEVDLLQSRDLPGAGQELPGRSCRAQRYACLLAPFTSGSQHFVDAVTEFSWEPKGERFAIISSSDPNLGNPAPGITVKTDVSFYQLVRNKGDFKLLRKSQAWTVFTPWLIIPYAQAHSRTARATPSAGRRAADMWCSPPSARRPNRNSNSGTWTSPLATARSRTSRRRRWVLASSISALLTTMR